jgi:purine-cytosine permease-like protein
MSATMIAPAEETAPVMSVKDWLVTSLIMIIPLVGFIMLFVWAFGDGTNPNKANWAKASLLMSVIAIGFSILIFAVVGAAILGAAS